MNYFNKVAALFFVCAFVWVGCEQGKQGPVADEDTGFTSDPVVAENFQLKKTVSGCSGDSGSASEAKNAFESGDLAACNEQASCAFNSSVQLDGNKPDQEAAFYGFLCKLALTVESPVFSYLAMEEFRAADYFQSSSGNIEALGDKLETKFPGDGLVFLKNFVAAHIEAGHSVEEVSEKFAELVLGMDDLRTLASAMALPPEFEKTVPASFVGQAGPGIKVTYVEAAAIANILANVQVGAELLKIYRVGIDSSDSFANVETLTADLNQTPKAFSLRSEMPSTDALRARLHVALGTWEQAVANLTAHPTSGGLGTYEIEDWARELLPMSTMEQPYVALQIARQLVSSLQGKSVWLSASEYQNAVNLDVFLKNLPDADEFSGGDLFVYDSGDDDFELDGDTVSVFLSGVLTSKN